MPETNGSGRLENLEALLDKMGQRLEQLTTTSYLHEDRLTRIETGIEEMQEEEATYRRQQRERDGVIDARIDRLVSAIGEIVRRLP